MSQPTRPAWSRMKGKSRNVALFNRVRRWSYSAIRPYWGKDPGTWETAVMAHTNAANQEFEAPLDDAEMGVVALSVAHWTWHNTTPESFSEVQAKRGAKGGLKGGATLKGIQAMAASSTARRIIRDEEMVRRLAL